MCTFLHFFWITFSIVNSVKRISLEFMLKCINYHALINNRPMLYIETSCYNWCWLKMTVYAGVISCLCPFLTYCVHNYNNCITRSYISMFRDNCTPVCNKIVKKNKVHLAAVLEEVGQASGIHWFSILWAVSSQFAAVWAEPKAMGALKWYPSATAFVVI